MKPHLLVLGLQDVAKPAVVTVMFKSGVFK